MPSRHKRLPIMQKYGLHFLHVSATMFDDVGCGMWDVRCGMWDVGCEMWDVGCEMWDVNKDRMMKGSES